jgi:chromate reductase
MTGQRLEILGFAGSLRKGSFNRGLLRLAGEIMPAEAVLEIFDLAEIPPFNLELELDMPHAPRELKKAIEKADALLIATPEYNYSFSGVLKNAIDWASRPTGSNSFAGKPAAIMSASTGFMGGGRAQYHLRQVLTGLNVMVLNKPELMVTMGSEKFDAEGNLTDGKARENLAKLLEALVAWTQRLKGDS